MLRENRPPIQYTARSGRVMISVGIVGISGISAADSFEKLVYAKSATTLKFDLRLTRRSNEIEPLEVYDEDGSRSYGSE